MTITRARACEGKRRLSQQAALRAVERLEAAGTAEGAMAAYECPFGDHWHVGHVPRRAAQQETRNRRRR